MISVSQKRSTGVTSFARAKFGLTQQQLAETLGVSRSLIAMLETGKRELPSLADSIYIEMSRRAAELPESPPIAIKRGRKPTNVASNLFEIPVVTNYNPVPGRRRRNFIASRRSSLASVKAQSSSLAPLVETGNSIADHEPGNQALEGPQRETFIKQLQDRKEILTTYIKILEIKKERMQEKGVHLSGKLMLVNALLDAGKPLEDTLPGGRAKDRLLLRNAFNNYQQIKLSQQLKKCDHIASLKAELQLNFVKGHIALIDEYTRSLTAVTSPGNDSGLLL